MMRDIVLILSDQHSGCAVQSENPAVYTPFLAELESNAQVFESAYCNCPLCVPSRMSFLSGKAPHELEIYDNDTVLSGEVQTIAHQMSSAGYRTVLCGRMHFKGEDQLHGFEERYVGDITTQWWGQKRTDLGAFQGTMQMKGCLNDYGYGNSPVQEYDEAVFKKSLELLEEDSDRPLFLVIGFYGPHFPYCSKKDTFDRAYEKVLDVSDASLNCDGIYSDMIQHLDDEGLRHIRSAYYGLIEQLDGMLKEIHTSVRKHHQDALLIYTSDHGDQIGKRKLYGKKTLYEESIRIPLLIEDLNKKPTRHTHEVSLLNLHATVLDEAKINSSEQTVYEMNNPVLITSLIEKDGKEQLIQSVIHQGMKLVKTDQFHLYSLKKDPNELKDVIDEYPLLAKQLASRLVDDQTILSHRPELKQQTQKMKEWTKINQPEDWIRYQISQSAQQKPRRNGNEV